MQTEPKFVVFVSQLLLLFNVCPSRNNPDPLVEVTRIGTMAKVATICTNQSCNKKQHTWNSQPDMSGTKIPAGNFLLSFAILISGGFASKVFLLFKHMGLSCIQELLYQGMVAMTAWAIVPNIVHKQSFVAHRLSSYTLTLFRLEISKCNYLGSF